MKRKIIIFDLDQTIVEILPIHDAAIAQAFKQVLGFEGKFSEVDFPGRMVEENIELIAKVHGIARLTQEVKNQIKEVYQTQLLELLPAVKNALLPGAKELVRALKKRGHFLALATGTPTSLANAILRHARLRNQFDVVVGGDFPGGRSRLFQSAKEQCERIAGEKLETVVIGDSSRDILAGKELGAKTIAVLTGPEPKEKVLESKPDVVVEQLTATDLIKKIEE